MREAKRARGGKKRQEGRGGVEKKRVTKREIE